MSGEPLTEKFEETKSTDPKTTKIQIPEIPAIPMVSANHNRNPIESLESKWACHAPT